MKDLYTAFISLFVISLIVSDKGIESKTSFVTVQTVIAREPSQMFGLNMTDNIAFLYRVKDASFT